MLVDGVIILPFGICDGKLSVLLRYEISNSRGMSLTVISGRRDGDEEYIDTVFRELKEESGYEVDFDDIVYVSDIYYAKDSTVSDKLFVVFIRDTTPHRPLTDGTYAERVAENVWCSVNELLSIVGKSSNGPLLCAFAKIFPILFDGVL